MRKRGMILAAVLAMALMLCLMSGCGPASYTVTFDLNGGELVSGELSQSVEEGSAAVAPEAVNGRMVLSWDKDFSGITEDTTVTAQWEKVAMSGVELAEYVQERTVTVNVELITGGSSVGSGFFIDDQGTILTNYHVIDMGVDMMVEVSDGGRYPVETVVDFSPVYDLAVLKLDMSDTPHLNFAEEAARTGEPVHAVGSALGELTGSFTSGKVSSTKRTVGRIECLQMDAAISSGNSGGPLVNDYGEVVGINTFSYVDGENLNLAIKPAMLDKLSLDKNWTMNEFKEWYTTESSRSYSPYDADGYYYSLVNTYQIVTGAKCLYSGYNSEDDPVEGYHDMYDYYVYEYVVSEFDQYVEYLKSQGFVFDTDERFDGGISYYYYNEKDGILADLFITNDNEYLYIWMEV